MQEKLFSDNLVTERAHDSLTEDYSTADVASRIWHQHLRPRVKLLVLSSLAMIVSAATTGAVPLLIQRATDDIFVNQNSQMVLVICFAVIAVTTLKTFAEYISNVTVGYLGQRFVADMRIQMFDRLTKADLSWVEAVHSGRFLSGFLNDANLIRATASKTLVALVENFLKVVALTAVMFWIDWKMALMIMIAMPLGVYLLSRQRKKMRTSTKKGLVETGELSTLITQTLRGLRIVRAYGQEQNELNRASTVINNAMEYTMRGMRAQAISSPFVELLTGLGVALVIYYAGTNGIKGNITLGQFTAFMAAAMLIYQPLKSLATLQTAVQEGVAAAGRVFGIIDHQPELIEKPGATQLTLTRGEISFENVSFAYEDDNPVFKDFSLTVPPGKTVALVGPSGSGKSTILNLVLRFYDPSSGRVMIDGQDLSSVTLSSLRDSIALVTQEPLLFDDSIAKNIAYGSNDATSAEIAAAAKAAAAEDFINAFPKGFETGMGEAGNNLSGGEKQRIAIARAILKDAPILLLDEPTSALDSKSEATFQEALNGLIKGRTVLMIAHRLSTVKQADLVVVLAHGKMVEMGSYDELLANGGLFAELHATQFGFGDTDTSGDQTADIVDGGTALESTFETIEPAKNSEQKPTEAERAVKDMPQSRPTKSSVK